MVPNETHLARARYLRTLLAWHGMNTADFARILGCSQQAASYKLLGKRNLSADDISRIVEALDVEPRYLLTVPGYERGLLTCTFKQLPQVRGCGQPLFGISAKSALFTSSRAA
jgi:transcriptional regulator with XRE-family HTH domain